MKPTIGRIVHFYHVNTGGQPTPAMITHVLESGTINVTLFIDTLQEPNLKDSKWVDVPHKDDSTDGGPFWDWPPRT